MFVGGALNPLLHKPYIGNAVEFDGTADQLFFSAPTGVPAASRAFTISTFLRIPSVGLNNGVPRAIASFGNFIDDLDTEYDSLVLTLTQVGTGAAAPCQVTMYGYVNFGGFGTTNFIYATAANLTRATNYHIYAFGDLDVGDSSFKIYVNGVDATQPGFYSELGDLKMTGASSIGGASTAGLLRATIGETWADLNTRYDPATYVSRFYSSGGHPMFIGSDGSLPTGVQPDYYLKGNAAGYATNSGSAGNGTLFGTLVDQTPF